jgi:hypothetical protein
MVEGAIPEPPRTLESFLQEALTDALEHQSEHLEFAMLYKGAVVEATLSITRVYVPGATIAKQ